MSKLKGGLAASRVDSPLKWHSCGGKHYLAPKLWDIAKAVPHVHRVEVFGGSLAFTLATEPEGFSEVVNDRNKELMNFWSVLAHPSQFVEFQQICEATPFAEPCFDWADSDHDVESFGIVTSVSRAWRFFIRCRQSMAGRMTNFAPLSKRRTRRGMNEQVSAWLTTVEGLPGVHSRLKRIAVRRQSFSKLIPSEDSESTLFYCDPPYLHETRSTTSEYGEFEMSESDHRCLLNRLSVIRGKFMLSGYRSPMYDEWVDQHQYRRIEFDLPNNSASGATKERKTECVWCNF